MGDLIGYARVSSRGQSLDVQRDKLTAAGCRKIFEETASGTRDDRPRLKECLNYVREGDVFMSSSMEI